jgi:polyisoprenoid-binding protein YceI
MKLLKGLFLSALAFGTIGSLFAAVETYTIDPVHSSVGFSVRHMGVSKVPGSFTSFKGTITVDRDNMEKSSVEATIDTASLSTANEKRDNHVKSADFLDVATNPAITFKSKSWKKTGEDTYDVTGDLSIKGTTKEVTLAVTALGFGTGGKGAPNSGWEAKTTIKKSDYGVKGPAAVSKVVGDEVAITINIEANATK